MPTRPEPRRNDEQGFVRTTISLPARLKARMERVAVNWSAVASEAFERHLEQQGLREEPMSDDEAIARLRRLKEAAAHAADPSAAAGRRWAMADAHPDELAKLERYFEQRLAPGGRTHVDPDPPNPRAVMQLARDIAAAVSPGSADPSRQGRWKQFWKERSGLDPTRPPAPADLYAFCESAVQFWREVKDKV